MKDIAKLEAVLATIGHGISIQSVDFKVLYQNDAHKKIIGNHVGEYCFRGYRKRDRVCDSCPLVLTFRDGKTHAVEHATLTDHGTIHVDVTASPLRSASGKIIAGIEVVRDITARKLTEERLQKSEARLQYLISASPAVIYTCQFGGDWTTTFMSENIRDVLGYEARETLENASFWSDRIHPEDSHRIIDGLSTLYEHDSYISKYRFLHKDGTYRWMLDKLQVTRGQDGKPIECVGSWSDITELKKGEDALRESEERFRQIFEQSVDALFLFKAGSDEIIDVNPSAIHLYGYTRDECIGRGLSLILSPDEILKYKQALADIGPTGVIRIDRLSTTKKDGAAAIVSVWGYFVKLKQNDVLTCSFRDISEKIRLEEETKLIQAKLIHANKMASLGTLISGVAHEINNPNNYISFNARLLAGIMRDLLIIMQEYRGKNLDVEIGNIPFSELRTIVPKLLDGIADGSQRIDAIVSNLKNYARKDGTGVNEPVDIHKVIATSAALLGNQIRKRSKHFDLDFCNNVPPIKGNAQQLEQVIVNLLTNALQSLPDRERGIWIATSFNKENQSIHIQIKDEGTGMSREVLDRIPEPFFTTKLAQGGTGLGLSISNSIIKDHRGALRFESEPGKGTIATVILPVYEGAARKD